MTGIGTFAGRAMGSPLRFQVTPGLRGTPPPELLWGAVQAEFSAVESELSCYRPESALSRLNGTAGSGAWWEASTRLYRFLALAQRAGRRTGDRFNAAVLGDLVRLGQPGLVTPAGGGTRSTHSAAGGWLEADARARRVRVAAPVDSGGLGKGLALRWAWRSVEDQLAGRGALLEAGGDIVGRAAPDGEP